MERARRLFPAIVFSSLIVVPAASAAPAVRQVDAAARGEVFAAAGAASRAELVDFGEGLASTLLQVSPQEKVRLTGWPVSPEERADVLLTRHDIYAPDAKIWKVGKNGGVAEVPRSRLAFFWGTAEGDEETRVFVSVDPDTQTFAGFSQTARAMHEMHPLKDVEPAARGSRRHVVAAPEFFLAKAGETPEWTCAQTGAPLDLSLGQETAGSTTVPLFAPAISSLHTATIAVDTDNEIMVNKFGNNTTTAANYIASLVAAMNVIYERDLLIRLLQGQTFLRQGNGSDGNSYNDDPYVQAGATTDKLFEFTNYWSANQGGVTRALAMLLSGRGTSGAAGVAWIDTLCSKTHGYSFNQVFLSGTSPSFGDVLVVAHEIGHNFGSPHTHCYSTPLDNCYNAESGCYAGTRSCPAPSTINGVTNVTGTLMSYCHLSGLAGCGSSQVFHPASVTLLNPKIQNRVNTCIFPSGPPPSPAPTVSGVSPVSGSIVGGTPVTITGTNFAAGATVTFGGTAAAAGVVVNATTITAVAPAHAAGAVTVAVTNPSTQSGSKSNAYFYAPPPAVSDFYTLAPCRVLDTRNPNGARGGPVLGASGQRTFDVTGACGIPNAAKAISVNVTVVAPAASGYLSIFPGNAFPLGTSTLSFRAGMARASNSILTLATNGSGTIGVLNASGGNAHVIVDVNGYFQ